jgi:hypothetical protein
VTGHFSGPLVAGLPYVTPTHRGATDDSGSLTYVSGEEVTFFLGTIVDGRIQGSTLGSIKPTDGADVTVADLSPDVTRQNNIEA